ncbi:hypothetical protein GCM10009558_073970 [Virgisporangium aurantiacum]
MTIDLKISLFNFRNGGLRPNSGYDFRPLTETYAPAPAPDLIALCEAKFWFARGRTPFLTAVQTLSAATGRTYVGELFSGALATALVYDPNVFDLEAGEEVDFADKQNLARLRHRNDDSPLQILVEHWPFWDGHARVARAKLLATYGPSNIPTIIAGDLNSTASGPHLPTADWPRLPATVRDHKAQQDPDGSWHPDTRAVDRLIGRWNTTTGNRIDGAAFHHVAELDPDAPNPLPPTVNAGGSGLHIDYILINDACQHAWPVMPGSYNIHIPDPARPMPSDHRRVDITLRRATP